MNDITRAEFHHLSQQTRIAKETAVAALRKNRPASQASPLDELLAVMALAVRAATTQSTIASLIAAMPEKRAERMADLVSKPGRAFERAVTNPAQTTVPGWAAEITGEGVGPIRLFAPQSGFAQLAARDAVLRARIPPNGSVRLPRIADGDLPGAFIGEGQPIPVRKGNLGSLSLLPHKMGVISTFTRELGRQSDIEVILRATIRNDTQVAIDDAMFGSAAATPTQPAGLLNGATAVPASGDTGTEGVSRDLGALSAALPANVEDVVFISNASTRIRALLLASADALPWIVVPGFPANTVAALAGGLIAIGEDSDSFSFDTSEQGTLVNSDSEPVEPMMSPGTDSLFQRAILGLRMISFVSWGWRGPGGAALTSGIAW